MSEPEMIEVLAQEYDNGKISAGLLAEGDGMVYLLLQRPDMDTLIRLRPDELAAIAMCANGVLWSLLVGKQIDGEPNDSPDDEPRTE